VKLEFSVGLIVNVVAIVIFYLRIAQIRGRRRKLARQEALQRRKNPKKGPPPPEDPNKPGYDITSWWLVGLGIALMLLGVTMYTSAWFPVQYRDYWWVASSIGILVFAFCFK
jgi:hypothetical protein